VGQGKDSAMADRDQGANDEPGRQRAFEEVQPASQRAAQALKRARASQRSAPESGTGQQLATNKPQRDTQTQQHRAVYVVTSYGIGQRDTAGSRKRTAKRRSRCVTTSNERSRPFAPIAPVDTSRPHVSSAFTFSSIASSTMTQMREIPTTWTAFFCPIQRPAEEAFDVPMARRGRPR
jgi:hypothetical protein